MEFAKKMCTYSSCCLSSAWSWSWSFHYHLHNLIYDKYDWRWHNRDCYYPHLCAYLNFENLSNQESKQWKPNHVTTFLQTFYFSRIWCFKEKENISQKKPLYTHINMVNVEEMLHETKEVQKKLQRISHSQLFYSCITSDVLCKKTTFTDCLKCLFPRCRPYWLKCVFVMLLIFFSVHVLALYIVCK